MRSPAVRFCIALNAAALLSILAFELVPEELDVRTDIVGYPTYANFNINRYFWAYGFTVVLFPLLDVRDLRRSDAGFRALGRPREAPSRRRSSAVEAVPPVDWSRRAARGGSGATLLVGGVLGLEAAIILRAR